jgi:hypothetical protein
VKGYHRTESDRINEHGEPITVGTAMLMNVPTSFQILGYPALAIIFFLAAVGGGVALMLDILIL